MNAPGARMRRVWRALPAGALAVLLGGCGTAHDDGHWAPYPAPAVSVAIGVAAPVEPPPPPLAGLTLHLTRIGPEAVQLDWSYDPVAASYDVHRDGRWLAQVADPTLVDASGAIGEQYCYQVVGRDAWGVAVSTSSVGCLTLF